MHVTTRDVNTGFRLMVDLFHIGHRDGSGESIAIRQPYSNPNGSGHVLRIPGPVTTTFTHPRERVLFNTVRDFNPFFALYETLWMLAGRNDVAPLTYYNSKIKEFSDDGKTLNGAYGYRWRHSDCRDSGTAKIDEEGRVDQLDVLVNHLKTNPTSRRVVLSMWNVEDDLLKVGGDSVNSDPQKAFGSKDVCCNLNVMFELRCVGEFESLPPIPQYVLDMTVTARSSDLMWGLFGNDFVVFSFLQEYMAARVGVGVGLYHHFTNNLHVYADRPDWKPAELLAYDNPSPLPPATIPFVKDPAVFEHELFNVTDRDWSEPFLHDVAYPMFQSFHFYKNKDYDEVDGWVRCIKSDDWRLVCGAWLDRRNPKGA